MADNSRHREMQKTYLDELELLRTECDKAWKSMEEARGEAMTVKKKHDETMPVSYTHLTLPTILLV